MAAGDGFASASAALSRIHLRLRPSLHRLSHTFSEPTRPIISTRRQVAWVTLEGRLVGAAEATSYKSVGKGLSPSEAAAWELFTPLHRVLLVAIVAIASSSTSRSRRISQLQHSVDIRDEVLRNMQEKLDDLCKQMRLIKDESRIASSLNVHALNGEVMAEASEAKLCHCGTRVLHMDLDSCIVPLCSSQSIQTKDVYVTELSKDKLFENNHVITSEQDERRMSDLSDFCWSVASSADIQPVHLSTLAEEQELYNLRNECEEKDAIIKDLRTAVDDSNAASSKKIAELEEIIRRKNMITMELKKDIAVLEKQVKKLTKLQRQSSSSSTSSITPVRTHQTPIMAENILYDMSSTSPSSSDCGSPDRNRSNSSCISADQILRQCAEQRRQQQASSSGSKVERSSASPLLKENRVNRKGETNPAARQRRFEGNSAARERQAAVSSAMDNNNTKKARRRNFQEEKTSQKK
ncbi:hypothetical protein KSP39_PZI000064 [Platanthera zijinensis]|uniref:Uncharacterized protein n=1 Tax=Platanthera zijinensis TaxID=2320716 RepID=A0AAP0C227_9ASPA